MDEKVCKLTSIISKKFNFTKENYGLNVIKTLLNK
jgi:hypothetical protein